MAFGVVEQICQIDGQKGVGVLPVGTGQKVGQCKKIVAGLTRPVGVFDQPKRTKKRINSDATASRSSNAISATVDAGSCGVDSKGRYPMIFA